MLYSHLLFAPVAWAAHSSLGHSSVNMCIYVYIVYIALTFASGTWTLTRKIYESSKQHRKAQNDACQDSQEEAENETRGFQSKSKLMMVIYRVKKKKMISSGYIAIRNDG